MNPLKLEIKEIQYDISAKCNQITLTDSEGEKVFEFCDYDSYVDIPSLEYIINQYNYNII